MESNDPLPQAMVDPEPSAAENLNSAHAAPATVASQKLVPIRRQIVRAVPREPEIVKRQATVTYFRKMRKGRLCAMIVRLDERGGKDAPAATREGTVIVEPIIPGSLVYPSRAEVSTQPGSEVRLTVLPLSYDKPKVARIEFRSRGKTNESMRLPVKVVRRRLACLLLFVTVVLTALLAWDRHISSFEPIYVHVVREAAPAIPPANQQRSTADPRPPQGRPGTAEGIVQPPAGAPTASALKPPPEVPYRGEAAIEKWLEVESKRSSRNVTGDYELRDVAVLGLDAIHGWKFGGGFLEDNDNDQSLLIWGYRGWAILRNIPMSEVYLCGFLLGLTVLAWYLQGPARARRRSAAFEVAIP